MRREQAGQLVSSIARQPGAYHGGSGRPKIGICHKAMITGRPPSAGDQHAAICPIRAHQTTRARRPERQVTKYGCRIKLLRQARERLGQGLRAIEADHIAQSDEISLRNQ